MPNIWKANDEGVAEAVATLNAGRLVAVPTETVYGLAGDAEDGRAVAAIYATKGRPSFNPLIVHVLDLAQAATLAEVSPRAALLAAAFWPGPLTLVMPLRADARISQLVTAGHDSVAVRAPAHATARAILAGLGRPFVAPSANKSGRVSPTTAAHVIAEFGSIVPVVDGGPCTVGLESTIVDVRGDAPCVLRPGQIDREAIETLLKETISRHHSDVIVAPGMLTSHYAPGVSLRLNAAHFEPDESGLGFGGTPGATLDLSPSGDLIEAAANFFAYIRRLDALGRPIAVAPIPNQGVGVAINDRLSRGAAPKPAA